MDTKNAKTRELVEKDNRYVWHALSRYTPSEGGGTTPAPRMLVAEGKGAWISDTEGNHYLDGMSGLWCVNVGYGREELARAAYDQLATLPYYPLTMGHEPAVRLGEKLNEWLDDEYIVYYSNSGSEANEVAFKIARQYHQQNGEPGRHKFVSRYRAYHGNTFGGNPAACALALRNLEIMEEENLPAQSAAMGERLRAQLADLEDHPNVGQIRNKGLLFGLELVEDKESRTPATAEKVGAVIAGCKERGLIVGKNGDTVAGFNNVVTLAPPLIVTDDDLEFISGTLKESLASL